MQKTVITPHNHRVFPDLGEVWRYRQLLFSLAWRDIRVKYAQTIIGIIWAFINPIFNLIVLSFVFGVVVKVDTGQTPHLLFTITGLAGWTYFSTLVSEAGNSIIGAQAMVKKIYFPRLIIPLSKALSGLIDFSVTLICLFGLMLYYGVGVGKHILYFPLFFILVIISGLAGGILISALTVRFRDFSFVVPMIVRVGLYATPVAYSAADVPEKYRLLYFLNPMAGIVEGFRWSLFGTDAPEIYMFYSVGIIMIMFLIGLMLFEKIQRKMADIL